MKTARLITFLLLLAPALSFAQDKTGNCATADTVLMHIREAGAPANMSLTKNSACQLVLGIEGYTIVKFDMSMTVKGEYRTRSCKGAELNKNMQTALSQAPRGTKVIVHNIVAKDASGKVARLEDKELKL